MRFVEQVVRVDKDDGHPVVGQQSFRRQQVQHDDVARDEGARKRGPRGRGDRGANHTPRLGLQKVGAGDRFRRDEQADVQRGGGRAGRVAGAGAGRGMARRAGAGAQGTARGRSAHCRACDAGGDRRRWRLAGQSGRAAAPTRARPLSTPLPAPAPPDPARPARPRPRPRVRRTHPGPPASRPAPSAARRAARIAAPRPPPPPLDRHGLSARHPGPRLCAAGVRHGRGAADHHHQARRRQGHGGDRPALAGVGR